MTFIAADISAKLTLDRDPFQQGLRLARAEAEAFEKRTIRAKVDVDRSAMDVGRDAQWIPVKPKLDEGAVAALRGQLAAIKAPKVTVDVDVRGAGKLVALRAQLAAIRDKVVNVRVDTSVASRNLRFLLIGSVVAAVGALVSLAGPAAAATAALGGLGVAAVGALAPFALLTVAMVMFGKAGGQVVKDFKAQAKELGEAFKSVSAPAATKVFRALTREMGAMAKMLPTLKPGITALGGAIATMVGKLGGKLVSPEFVEFYQRMIKLATDITPSLTKSMMALLEIFKNVSTAGAAPLAEQLEKLATWLTKIGEKTSNVDALEASMRRGLQAGGLLWQVVKNIGSVFKSLYTATMAGNAEFLRGIGESTKGLAEFFKSADGQKTLRDMLKDLGGFLNSVIRSLPTLVQGFGMFLTVATAVLKIVVGVIGTLNKIPLVGPALAGIVGAFILMKGPIGAVAATLRTVVGLLGRLAGPKLAGALAGVTGGRAGGVATTGTPVGRRGTPGGGGAAGRAAGGVQKITGVVELGPKSLAAIRSAGGGAAGKAGKGAGAAAGGAAAGGAAAKTGGKAAGAGFIASMAAAIKAGRGKVTSALRGVLGKLGPLFKRIPGVGAIATVIGGAFKKLKLGGLLGKALKLLPKVITSFLPRILGAFLGWPVAIGLLIYTLLPKKVKDAIGKGIKTVAKAIVDAGKFVVGNIAKGIGAAAKWVFDGVKKIGGGIWKTVKGWASSLFNGGKNIIGKLGEGIKAGAGKVIDAAKWVAKQVAAVWPFSEPKDQSSPLRGLDKAGKALVKNIGDGVDKGTPALVAKVKAMAAQVREATTHFGGRATEKPLSSYDKVGSRPRGSYGAGGHEDERVYKGRYVPRDDMRQNTGPALARAAAQVHLAAKAMAERVAEQLAAFREGLVKQAELAYKPIRDAAARTLKGYEAMEAAAAGKPPTRQQQEADLTRRISQARYDRDDQGRELRPPPGVKRVKTQTERDLEAEQRSMRYEWGKEDLQTKVDVNVSAMIPSDPKVLREMQRSIGRAVTQGNRRRPSTVRFA